MEPITLALGLGISAIGIFKSMQAADAAEKAQEVVINNQQKAESARQQAMLLDATRKKREIVRQGIIARSQALAVGTSQGATGANSSAMGGVTGQIDAQQAFNYVGVNNAVSFGTDIFKANQGVLEGRRMEARAGADAAVGAGLTSLGGSVAKSSGSMGKIFG